MSTLATAGLRPDLYFSADITKVDELDDGSVMVYGIPAMPGVLDNDQQMVDPAWLKAALTEWYQNPNIREMHLPIAVGKGTNLDWQGDVPHLTAHIVDPLAVRKVRARVLRAFSIGIKHQVVKRIKQAAKGLIVGGKIIEVTLCDRPCIPGSDILDFKADVFKMASYISPDEIIDWQRGLAWKATLLPDLAKRDFDPGVGGGVDRDKLPADDFGDPDQRLYPIVTPKDVTDAAGLIGHADNPQKVKERITAIAHRKGPAFVDALPDTWTHDKESSKVADTDSTKTPDDGAETVAATEGAADVSKTTILTEEDAAKAILADIEKASATSAFCAECDKSMPIIDGKEQTVKGNKVLVGKDSAGHTLRKFVGTDSDKAAEADPDGEEAAKTPEADATKAPEADAAKADEKAADAEVEKGVIVVAPEHEGKPAEATKAADTEVEKTPEAETAKTVETPAPVAEKTADGDLVKAALVSLLQEHGIDLNQVAARTRDARIERLGAAFAEAQEILDGAKAASTGGPTTVTGLDANTAGRLRSCVDEINTLAGQMTGTPADGDATQPGPSDMGTATIAKPTDRIEITNYAETPTLTKTTTTDHGTSTALDAAELAKSIGAEVEKVLTPLRERLETVEYSVKPASPPVLQVAERDSPFVNGQTDAGRTAFKTAMESLEGVDDDTRAKLAAAFLSTRGDWPLAPSR